MTVPLTVVLFSCALLGFRHGFDYDHIAAILDIAGIEKKRWKTMRMGLLYALGHASSVAVLGGLVIGLGLKLPAGMDAWAERVVGLTLMVLAVYVLGTLVRTKGREMPRSRGALMVGGVRWLRGRVGAGGTRGSDLAGEVNGGTCFGIGVIHGLGAETPSQLALFLLAANLGGVQRGLVGLGMFLAGLLVMNTLMTAVAAGVFTSGRGWTWWPAALRGVTAVYSFWIGLVFLIGDSGLLKNIAG